MTNKDQLTINVDDTRRHVSGLRYSLIYWPESHHVGLGEYVGPGHTMAAHHRLALESTISIETTGEALAAYLRACEPLFDAIRDSYLGSHWDGSNSVGRWADDDAGGAAWDQIIEGIHAPDSNIPTYWDAGDFLSPILIELVEAVNRAMAQGAGLDAACAAVGSDCASDAISDDALIDAQEAAEWLRGSIDDLLDEVEWQADSDGDDPQTPAQLMSEIFGGGITPESPLGALAVARYRAARDEIEPVPSLSMDLARAYLKTPQGGWPETKQAWAQLVDVAGSPAAADRAVTRALADGAETHPDRDSK